MKKEHPHAAMLRALADGHEIEQRDTKSPVSRWEPFDGSIWNTYEYRIKPEPEYPVTRITGEELERIYLYTGAGNGYKDFIALANAAIKRAIQDGDVVIAEKKK